MGINALKEEFQRKFYTKRIFKKCAGLSKDKGIEPDNPLVFILQFNNYHRDTFPSTTLPRLSNTWQTMPKWY